MQDRWNGLISSVQTGLDGCSKEQKWALGAVGAVTGCALVARLFSGSGKKGAKPSSWQLTGGSISRDSVAKEFKQYSASYGADGTGVGITDRERTVQLVDVFYSLVTDIYEWWVVEKMVRGCSTDCHNPPCAHVSANACMLPGPKICVNLSPLLLLVWSQGLGPELPLLAQAAHEILGGLGVCSRGAHRHCAVRQARGQDPGLRLWRGWAHAHNQRHVWRARRGHHHQRLPGAARPTPQRKGTGP